MPPVMRERIEIKLLVEQILSECAQELSKRSIEFSKEISEESGVVWADREKLEKCIRYLMGHALNNIQEKGRITVRLGGSEKYIRFEILGADSGDFGERMRKIFDLFEDIKTGREQAVGMWLAVLRDILELHKGKIWVEEEGDRGSKCILSLPRDLRKRVRIVIADDNPDICQTLKDILTEKEYLVDTVKNGYELVAYLRENNPKIVILDLMMPEKDGTEVFNTIRTIQANVKIIIYTGFQRFENSPYARSAERFLLKDENPEKLLQAIEELI